MSYKGGTLRQLEFTAEAEKRLQLLMDKMCVNSTGHVIDAALILLEWAQGEREEGRTIGSVFVNDGSSFISVEFSFSEGK